MKKLIVMSLCFSGLSLNAQIVTPQPSPAASIKQTVGITDVEILYSRPAKRGRVIFGDLVPFDQVWRTGANKNTTLTSSDVLVFGKDTLKAGTYAVFTKPGKTSWEVYFYTDTENWGTPDTWDAAKVALTVKGTSKSTADAVESFTIGFENVESDGAILSFSWDKTDVNIPFKVATTERVMDKIAAVMSGPSANDFYRAADFYLSEKKELNKALEWMNKAISMQTETPFWMLRKKSLIQAELGDYKGAIATAKESLAGATAAKNDAYIKMNEESIKEWGAK